MKQTAVLYIHGKNGSAAECERYKPLFPECEVIGLDYQTFTPWETGAHIRSAEHNPYHKKPNKTKGRQPELSALI